jgi:hypothetical protein
MTGIAHPDASCSLLNRSDYGTTQPKLGARPSLALAGVTPASRTLAGGSPFSGFP